MCSLVDAPILFHKNGFLFEIHVCAKMKHIHAMPPNLFTFLVWNFAVNDRSIGWMVVAYSYGSRREKKSDLRTNLIKLKIVNFLCKTKAKPPEWKDQRATYQKIRFIWEFFLCWKISRVLFFDKNYSWVPYFQKIFSSWNFEDTRKLLLNWHFSLPTDFSSLLNEHWYWKLLVGWKTLRILLEIMKSSKIEPKTNSKLIRTWELNQTRFKQKFILFSNLVCWTLAKIIRIRKLVIYKNQDKWKILIKNSLKKTHQHQTSVKVKDKLITESNKLRKKKKESNRGAKSTTRAAEAERIGLQLLF